MIGKCTYLLEFILAEKGFDEIFSSIGLFTDGIGILDMPLSYSLRCRSELLFGSGLKLVKSIYKPTTRVSAPNETVCLPSRHGRLSGQAGASWADSH